MSDDGMKNACHIFKLKMPKVLGRHAIADPIHGVTCQHQYLGTLLSAGYSFLLPFTWQTWLLFLVAMLVVVLLLTGMDIATRKARHAALEQVDTRKLQRSRKRGMRIKTAAHLTCTATAQHASSSLTAG
jgi:carbon starvation protein CstA